MNNHDLQSSLETNTSWQGLERRAKWMKNNPDHYRGMVDKYDEIKRLDAAILKEAFLESVKNKVKGL